MITMNSMQRIRVCAAAAMLANWLATAMPAWADDQCNAHYSVTDLGSLGGQTSAHDINDRGMVVGFSSISANNPDLLHAFLWSRRHGIEDLGTLGGETSNASAINDHGEVVGFGPLQDESRIHAFRWTRTLGLRDLGAGDDSYASDINNGGAIVGSMDTPQGDSHAFLWSPTRGFQDLGTLAGGETSAAFGINNRRQVVGNSDSSAPGGALHAFFWSQKSGMQDIGTLGGASSFASRINNRGEVVGSSNTPGTEFPGGPPHAFLWSSPDGIQDLGTLGGPASYSAADDINNRGQVVGTSQLSGPSFHAFLWSRDCGMRDINALISPNSDVVLNFAHAINNRGEIVGDAQVGRTTRAYLLTPVGGDDEMEELKEE
jgi:probable HAF family extracellular repeat protein